MADFGPGSIPVSPTPLEPDDPAELDAFVGKPLGTSSWLTITQTMIDGFAEATGDRQWIHVDVARARAERPGGTTIAHGFLTLSLVPVLAQQILQVRHQSHIINYGTNRVRFIHTVPAGSRVRLHQSLKASEAVENGRRLTMESVMEIEGEDRPALVAETIIIIYR